MLIIFVCVKITRWKVENNKGNLYYYSLLLEFFLHMNTIIFLMVASIVAVWLMQIFYLFTKQFDTTVALRDPRAFQVKLFLETASYLPE